MLDSSKRPKQTNDTQADVSPYKVPSMIWELIESYFESHYKLQVVDNYPDKNVTGPTITWTTVRRTPGRDGSKIHGKGANFVKFINASPEGFVYERYTQQQSVIYEYSIFAVSTELAETIAWDLERAILECVGVMQTKIEGFQMVFDQQTMDTSMAWRQQDQLVRKTIRFLALVPINFTQLVPQLRMVEVSEYWGRFKKNDINLIRTTSDKYLYIPVDTNQKVLGIIKVYMQAADEWTGLILNTDYRLKRKDDQSVYIEWLDDYGRVPQVGETFRVDYEIAQLVKSHNITPK